MNQVIKILLTVEVPCSGVQMIHEFGWNTHPFSRVLRLFLELRICGVEREPVTSARFEVRALF